MTSRSEWSRIMIECDDEIYWKEKYVCVYTYIFVSSLKVFLLLCDDDDAYHCSLHEGGVTWYKVSDSLISAISLKERETTSLQ